jgi:hypothetical protein
MEGVNLMHRLEEPVIQKGSDLHGSFWTYCRYMLSKPQVISLSDRSGPQKAIKCKFIGENLHKGKGGSGE